VSGSVLTITGAGSVTVQASQGGNTNYLSATSVSDTFTVNKATQTITFPNPGTQTYGVSSIRLTATASSGLPVSYTVSSGPASVSGSVLTITGAGSVTVQASQGGNTNYLSATSVSDTFTVNKAAQTITFPIIPTQTGPGTVNLNATASSGLPVSYAVTSGPATVSGSSLTTTGAGSITVQASQAGNNNYLAATPVSQTFTVSANAGKLNGSNCNGEYNGTYNGNLTVSAGQTCIFTNGGVTGNLTQKAGTVVLGNNSFVNGNLQMNAGSLTVSNSSVGGSLQITGASSFMIGAGVTIAGSLQIQSLPVAAGTDQVCGSNVKGSLTLQNSGAAVQIGSGSGCAGNSVGGNLLVQNNTAATTIDSNTVGGNLTDQNNTAATTIDSNTVGGNLTDQNNTAATTIDSNTVGGNLIDQNNTAATQVFTNTIKGNLMCSGNTAISGGSNKAASKQGQCAKF
jgi:hypothetical protein